MARFRKRDFAFLIVGLIGGILVALILVWGSGDEPAVTLPDAGKPKTERRGTPPKIVEGPQGQEPIVETIDRLQIGDWAPLYNPLEAVADERTADFRAVHGEHGLRFSKSYESGLVWLTNKHVLYGDFSVQVRVILPPATFENRQGPAVVGFGVRPSMVPWALDLNRAVPRAGPMAMEHVFEARRTGDMLQFAVNGHVISQYPMSHVLGHAAPVAPPQQAAACHFYVTMSQKSELWISQVTIRRPAKTPIGVPAMNQFTPPEQLLPSLFGERPVQEGETILMLPASMQSLAIGGGGNRLVAYLPQTKRIVVVDLVNEKVVHEVDTEETPVEIVAANDRFFVAQGGRRLAAWRFASLEMEQEVSLAEDETLVSMATGGGTNGPLLIKVRNDKGICNGRFYHPSRLQPLPTTLQKLPGRQPLVWENDLLIRASTDGRVFCVASQDYQYSIQFVGEMAFVTSRSRGEYLPAVIGPHGEVQFGGRYFVETGGIREQPPALDREAILLPSANGRYWLAVGPARKPRSSLSLVPARVQIYLRGHTKELAVVDDLDLTFQSVEGERNKFTGITFGQRIGVLPSGSCIFTIPRTNDRIVFRKLDLNALADAAGADHLYFDSPKPPMAIVRGTEHTHQFSAKAAKGPVRITLSRPERGVSLTGDGLMTWAEPLDSPQDFRRFQLQATDASGESIEYVYQPQIMDPPNAGVM